MPDRIACLTQGKVELLLRGQAAKRLESPYQEQVNARRRAGHEARIVSITRGRISAELCYAISVDSATGVFAQVPGTREEHRLFQSSDTRISELDFSFADEALACTVVGERGTSAIGLLADDGKGVRTVTEGDVVDRAPRFVPGGRAELVYASAGIGRTSAGAWAGLSPYSLHRLRFVDNSVEVLMSDAKYDYLSPVPISESLLYAIRRRYQRARAQSPFRLILSAFTRRFLGVTRDEWRDPRERELLRVTAKGAETVAEGVLAYDIAANGEVIYSNGAGVFRITGHPTSKPDALANLENVEQLVIC